MRRTPLSTLFYASADSQYAALGLRRALARFEKSPQVTLVEVGALTGKNDSSDIASPATWLVAASRAHFHAVRYCMGARMELIENDPFPNLSELSVQYGSGPLEARFRGASSLGVA